MTYSSCVIVADRISGLVQHLTGPCPEVSFYDGTMLADTPIAAHSFSFPRGMWGKERELPAHVAYFAPVSNLIHVSISLLKLLNIIP